MKKVKTYKGFIIALDKKGTYHLFVKDEWVLGAGCRYEEWSTENMEEAIDFIDSY